MFLFDLKKQTFFMAFKIFSNPQLNEREHFKIKKRKRLSLLYHNRCLRKSEIPNLKRRFKESELELRSSAAMDKL